MSMLVAQATLMCATVIEMEAKSGTSCVYEGKGT